jgi:hypothetical protein
MGEMGNIEMNKLTCVEGCGDVVKYGNSGLVAVQIGTAVLVIVSVQ